MKTTNAGLTTVLANNARLAADLYTFYFAAGTQHWTSAPTDLVSGSTTWSASGPVITRETLRSTAGVETDTLTITLSTSGSLVSGLSPQLAAIQGYLDNVRVTVQRAYMTTWGSIPMPITVFDGSIIEVRPSSTEVSLTLKSLTSITSRPVPTRFLQPACPFIFGDSRCGKNITDYQVTKAVSSGTYTSVVVASTSPFINVGGTCMFDNGTFASLKRTVSRISGSTVFFTQPTPAPIDATSATFWMGCDKTRTTCSGTFSNIARFGGFPDVPTTDAWK